MTTLEKIKKEIQKVLDKERDFTSENAKAQAMALMWCLEIIDRYASEECDNDCEHCAYIECPKEPCEDAVSRQAVKDMLNAMPKWSITKDKFACGVDVDEVIDGLEQLPSVQPKAKTGHWIRLPKNGLSGLPWYECSECEKERCIAMLRDFNYCPNCGAEMRGDTE